MDSLAGASPGVIGQLLPAVGLSRAFYGPWFPRQGDRLLASWEIIEVSESCAINVFVDSKNAEETDAQAVQLATLGLTVNATSVLASGCKELVRYAYAVSGGTGEWVHLRALPPSWIKN